MSSPGSIPLSIIIPTLNEAPGLVATLQRLTPMRLRGIEVIVIDGGSTDRTAEIASSFVDRVVTAPRGRAYQMNAGAAVAHGDILLFLHADTHLPHDADRLVILELSKSGRSWGRFDAKIDSKNFLLSIVSLMMNVRSRLSGIATGDQAMFVRSATFQLTGGFPEIPLMEDIALSVALKRIGPPLCLNQKVMTSGRRWVEDGIIRTILLMWRLRLAYFLGADPRELAWRYGSPSREN